MTSKRRAAAGVCIAAMAITSAYIMGRARAAGVPTMPPLMTYSGTLTDTGGTSLTGQKNIQIQLWDREIGGTTPVCIAPSTSQTLFAGGFQVPLPETCAAAVHATSDLWAEVLVDGTSLGRTKIGAVPFALESAHAILADSAGNLTAPYFGANGVTVTGTSVMADTSYVQRRISTACAAGSSIRAIDVMGAVTCEPDDNTVFSAGIGLRLLAGNTFAIATPQVVGVTATSDVAVDVSTAPTQYALCSLTEVSTLGYNDPGTNRWCTIKRNSDSTWIIEARAGTGNTQNCQMICF
jgi:hypothetical protein